MFVSLSCGLVQCCSVFFYRSFKKNFISPLHVLGVIASCLFPSNLRFRSDRVLLSLAYHQAWSFLGKICRHWSSKSFYFHSCIAKLFNKNRMNWSKNGLTLNRFSSTLHYLHSLIKYNKMKRNKVLKLGTSSQNSSNTTYIFLKLCWSP